jgi:hypothetical protein
LSFVSFFRFDDIDLETVPVPVAVAVLVSFPDLGALSFEDVGRALALPLALALPVFIHALVAVAVSEGGGDSNISKMDRWDLLVIREDDLLLDVILCNQFEVSCDDRIVE